MAGTRMRRNAKQTSAAIATPVLAAQGSELHDCDATALALISGEASVAEAAVAPQEETLEEIDTEEDDSEFDERAHWGRRRVSAKSKAGASGARKKKAPVEDKSQPKINLFCVQKPSAAKETKGGEADDAGNEDDHGEGSGGNADEAVDAVTVVEEDDDGNGGSSVEVLVKSANAGPHSPAVSAEAADTATAIVLEETLMSPATTTQSGRPKRQSVLRAEQAQLKASQESLFMTPPAFPPSKKTSANKATLDSEETEKKATTNSATLSSRKRKLEMAADKKKPAQQTTLIPKAASPVPVVSPAQSVAAKASDAKPARAAAKVFFLTEEQKKQVIEIEAVTLLKEQLRQQRERDLAFFGGREVQNPFFQSRSQKIIDVDAPEVIEVLDTPESSPMPRKSKSRWSKEQEEFPKLQHVLQIPSHHEDSGDTPLLLPMRKSAEARDVVVLDDEDEDMDESQSYSVSSSPDAADSQVPLDDLFWLLSSSMQATSSIDDEIVLLSLSGDLSTDVMIDKISEVYGIKEKRVRQTLTALELARDKRQDKALNLSLVDRYLPVQTHGMIGNNDTLKKLSAWLSAWKSGGGGDRDRNYDNDDALFAFEGDDSDSDEDGTQLYRLFVLKGDVGSGKSAAVYACAEELGYEIIEINAGQLRTGKAVVDIAGEATQSTRVLHGGGPLVNDSKSKKKRSSSKKKRRKDGEPAKPSHLSLVLFEDVDLVFEEDKGFLSTLGSIAKHSKCPIVVTCRDLPSGFPSTPPAICDSLVRPSSREFVAWLSLVAYLEAIPLTHVLATRLAELFACDVRRSLNFLQTYRQHIDRQVTHRAHDYHDSLAWSATQTSRIQADNVIAIADSQEAETETRRAVHVPAWSRHKLRSFDLCTSNFLPLLTGALCNAAPQSSRTKENDTRPREQKQRDVEALDDLWGVLDAVSFAEDWQASFAIAHRRDDADDHFFEAEALDELTADVRSISLAAFVSRNHHAGNGVDTIVPPLTLNACPLGDGVERALQAAQELDDRTQKATRLATLKTKLELPLVAKGSARVDWSFSGDYMPMVARLLESSEPMQESRGGRRRTSRRNHYLSEILTDMAVVDDIREFQDYSRYLEGAHDDEIVASSPFASPDPSPPTLPPHPLETSVAV